MAAAAVLGEGTGILHVVLSLGILLFASKLFAELFHICIREQLKVDKHREKNTKTTTLLGKA